MSEVSPENLPDAKNEATKDATTTNGHMAPRPDGPAYDPSAITVLEGLEAVRTRPSMYLGTTVPRGLPHLVWAIVDTWVGVARAAWATTTENTLPAHGGVRRVDHGAGTGAR